MTHINRCFGHVNGTSLIAIVLILVVCLSVLQQHTSAFQIHVPRRSASIGAIRSYHSKYSVSKNEVHKQQRGLSTSLKMKGPTHIHVESTLELPCTTNFDKDATLTRYMMLPVEHFVFVDMPMQSTLVKNEGDDTFTLTTPPIRFFQLDVSPIILCKLFRKGDSVVIKSEKCLLKGGPTVDKLNGCFNIDVCTTLTWIDSDSKRAIQSRSQIDAVIDPPAPFKYLGSSVLQKSGTMAMNLALKQIENAFIGSLTKDYDKWATDLQFRSTRDANVIQMKSNMINYETDVDRPLNEIQTSGEKIITSESVIAKVGSSKAAMAKLELENATLKRKLKNAETELRNIQSALSKVTSSLR